MSGHIALWLQSTTANTYWLPPLATTAFSQCPRTMSGFPGEHEAHCSVADWKQHLTEPLGHRRDLLPTGLGRIWVVFGPALWKATRTRASKLLEAAGRGQLWRRTGLTVWSFETRMYTITFLNICATGSHSFTKAKKCYPQRHAHFPAFYTSYWEAYKHNRQKRKCNKNTLQNIYLFAKVSKSARCLNLRPENSALILFNMNGILCAFGISSWFEEMTLTSYQVCGLSKAELDL